MTYYNVVITNLEINTEFGKGWSQMSEKNLLEASGIDVRDIEKFLEELAGCEESFMKVIDYCETRVTAEEGIPAIIGLDDLTGGAKKTFTPAPADEGLGLIQGLAALVFAYYYDKSGKVEDPYPAIAPAMSAMAEKFFRIAPYREVVKDFVKEEQK